MCSSRHSKRVKCNKVVSKLLVLMLSNKSRSNPRTMSLKRKKPRKKLLKWSRHRRKLPKWSRPRRKLPR